MQRNTAERLTPENSRALSAHPISLPPMYGVL
jgi:hypothetical protein